MLMTDLRDYKSRPGSATKLERRTNATNGKKSPPFSFSTAPGPSATGNAKGLTPYTKTAGVSG